MVKTKLAILPILCCREIVKNSIGKEELARLEIYRLALLSSFIFEKDKHFVTSSLMREMKLPLFLLKSRYFSCS